MIIVVALAVRALLVVGPQGVTEPPPAPVSTAPSPEPPPTSLPPTETPTESPTEPDTTPAPTPSESTEPAECTVGNPTARQPHPTDGRIHGGGLSFPKTAGFTPTEQQSYFTWAYGAPGLPPRVDPNVNPGLTMRVRQPTVDGWATP